MKLLSEFMFKGLNGYVRIVGLNANKELLWARHYTTSRFLELLQDYEPTPDIQLFILPVTRSRYSAKKVAACEARVLWVDIDRLDGYTPNFSIMPNVHVSSGKGHHYYWFLEDSVSLRDDKSQLTFEHALKALCGECNGDAAVTHVSANMRMPGSFNLKYPSLSGVGMGVQTSWNMIHYKPVPISSMQELADSYASSIQQPKPKPLCLQPTTHTTYKASSKSGKLPYMEFDKVIADECGAVQSALTCPSMVKEPEWFALLRLCAALPSGGDTLATNLSASHPDYSNESLSAKLSHAGRYKPPECSKLSMLNGCGGCKWQGHVKSPLGIPSKMRQAHNKL